MSSPSDQIVTSRERLQRIIDSLALLSVNELDPSKTGIVVEQEDDFALLEQTVNVFASELLESQTAKSQYLSQLEKSQRELQEKLSTIERQRAAIRDLSTPIIELWEDILTLPVVGTVDTQRSVEMTERLLQRISQTKARCVIIDITGVDVVDTSTANHFIKMVNSARLLGAYAVVTGISPTVAQTLTTIGVDFKEVKTLRSLKEGLRDCFLHLQLVRAESK